MRLFRQRTRGDWGSVFAEIGNALVAFAGDQRPMADEKNAPAIEREDKVKENLTIESGGRGHLWFRPAAKIAQNRCYARNSTS